MFSNFLLKFTSLTIFIFSISTFAYASNALSTLPFDIQIGITKNSEIENRGVCLERIEVTNGYFRCGAYNMANGRFKIFSSQNETVTMIDFYTDLNHSIPQNWQKIGLKLSNNNRNSKHPDRLPGNLLEEFLKIIQTYNATNIVQTSSTYTLPGSFSSWTFYEPIVEFDIDNNHYKAAFKRVVSKSHEVPKNSEYEYDVNLGLQRISVTESY